MEGVDCEIQRSHIFIAARGKIGYVTENNKKYEDKFENIPFLKPCRIFFYHNYHHQNIITRRQAVSRDEARKTERQKTPVSQAYLMYVETGVTK